MTQSTNYTLRVFLALALCLAAVPTTRAERLALSPTDIWETWTYPAGAVQLEERGPLRPILIAQNINSLANATCAVRAPRRHLPSVPLTATPLPAGDRLRAPL